VRRESCTCGTASRQKGHCVRCPAMCLPQNTHRRLSDIGLAIAPILLPIAPLSSLDSRSSNRQGTPCGRVNPAFEDSVNNWTRVSLHCDSESASRGRVVLSRCWASGQARRKSCPREDFHSCRKASRGSRHMARRAGTQDAKKATPMSIRAIDT
jgi:hypothetical protein